jgi:hypothetical protein
MSEFKIGQLYDPAFATMQPQEVQDNLNGIAWGIEERAYTKNLTPEEIVEKKDEYAEIGLILSEIDREKKEAIADFKARAKQPAEEAKMLLDAIKFKSEQKYGKLHLVDDQDKGMMYFFDSKGVCVDARPLDKKERQMKLKTVNSNEE